VRLQDRSSILEIDDVALEHRPHAFIHDEVRVGHGFELLEENSKLSLALDVSGFISCARLEREMEDLSPVDGLLPAPLDQLAKHGFRLGRVRRRSLEHGMIRKRLVADAHDQPRGSFRRCRRQNPEPVHRKRLLLLESDGPCRAARSHEPTRDPLLAGECRMEFRSSCVWQSRDVNAPRSWASRSTAR
jgi:hypothetical protein